MINIETFASGSKGNCHLLTSGDTKILLDCGIGYKRLQTLMKGALPDAVLITHEHSDHANVPALRTLLDHGVEVAMTDGTAYELNLVHRKLKILHHSGRVKNMRFLCLDVIHDADEPVNFIVYDDDDAVIYITDCGRVPTLPSRFKVHINKIMIEMNYETLRLMTSEISPAQKARITDYHLSASQALNFLHKFSDAAEIHICHVSKRNGNPDEFLRLVQEIAPNARVVLADNRILL